VTGDEMNEIRETQRVRVMSTIVRLGFYVAAVAAFSLLSSRAANASDREAKSMSSTEAGGGAKMDSAVKANAFREVLKHMGSGEKPEPKLWAEFVAAQNDDLKTGPKIGEKIPDFTLLDEKGKPWPLHELMGSKGLLLVFVRSADW
jgi:hypothetical protein